MFVVRHGRYILVFFMNVLIIILRKFKLSKQKKTKKYTYILSYTIIVYLFAVGPNILQHPEALDHLKLLKITELFREASDFSRCMSVSCGVRGTLNVKYSPLIVSTIKNILEPKTITIH